ncbi:hypothetical protein LSH36_251g05032 [Paralvinella palmiformis]|uniref:Apple domain-containing protein n=1 Tax=Paralvinella palmiformis TaxID=53620 RepID=A0AAD9JLS3_9ANNE|nr:hypothetical protein LSH36_251g05032 [Paralvinella palmiformis]
MDQCRELAEVILALTLLAYPASGECLFEKHHGYKLSEPAKASVTHGVRGVFRCEQLCLDYANKCLAANVIFLEANLYRCEIFTELPDAFSTDQLLVNPGGKFIRRKGPHKLTIESCSTGTLQSSKYVCDNAYDGVLDPGDNNEWSGMKRDPNVWIQLNLPALEVVEIVKIWWRCSGSSQFSLLELNFSDGSRQTVG